MTPSNNGTNRLFIFLTRKVCFSFAVVFFSALGAASAAPTAAFIWLTIPYESHERFYADITLSLILVACAALVHYVLFGLGRLWGKTWELRTLRVLNNHIRGPLLFPDIPTETLQDITATLEKLPAKNCRIAGYLCMPVAVLTTLHNYLLSGHLSNALYMFRSFLITITIYVIFTYMITELITAAFRRQARLMLAERDAWTGTQNASTLRLKFVFIITLMLISMMITRSLSTTPLIEDSYLSVFIHTSLTLIVAAFMCSLIFRSIITTMREIEITATHLGDDQRAQFISGSIDREFINTASGLFTAALKIIRYRDDLQHLNLTLEQRIAERTAQIELLSRTDPLTAIFNRGYLIDNLPQELKKALRYHRPFSIILCDLDHFKKVNDTYGHLAGDIVLKEFVACVISEYRESIDWIARYGGEEFVVALPETDLAGAQAFAERIRQSLDGRQIHADTHTIHVTVSCGVTGFNPDTPGTLITVENIIRQADRCLYQAKEAGRNCVVAQKLEG